MKNILITGGAGFLGRHLCQRLLEERVHVYCLDNLISGKRSNIQEFIETNKFRQYFHFIEADVVDDLNALVNNNLLPTKIHEIYHLACIASPPTYKFYSIETLMTSFNGTKNVLDLAKKCGAKVLFTSTSEVYGDPEVHPQPESYYGNVNTVGERSCYDEGKRVAETLLYEYRKKYNMDLKIVRIFNTYGPYMDIDDGRVITNFIKQIQNGQPLIIYGDGTQGRSFCYVDDMINGLVKMMESEQQGPINIGNPYTEFTLNELVCVFEKLFDRSLKVKHVNATENDPKQRRPDIKKAKQLLTWQPCFTLEDGIRKTANYFGLETIN